MPLQHLKGRWNSQTLGLLPPETPERVGQVFSRLGYSTTPDIIRVYSALGGMAEMDDGYFRLWSLEEIETENTEPSVFGILFADYMINCWCFRLRPGDTGSAFVYVDYFDGKPPLQVARSLDEFFEIYARDPKEVHAY